MGSLKLLPQFATAAEQPSHRMMMFKKALENVQKEPADIQYEVFRLLLLIIRDEKHRYFLWPVIGKVFQREIDIIEHWLQTGIPEEFPYGMGEMAVVAEDMENDWWENGMVKEANMRKEFDEGMQFIYQFEAQNADD